MMAQYGPGDGLAAFDAIGASGAAELRAAGIESVTALAKATSTRAGCRRLAAQLGVGPILVERWANLAALADALHAPAHDVNLLDRAGMGDLDVLGKVAPKSLASLLAKVANGDCAIPQATLKTWTDTARYQGRHLRRRTAPPQRH